jgi:hypothetical protein
MTVGFPSHGQPLNCQAWPMTKTATTRSQSALVNFAGLSITRYGTVKPPSFRRWSKKLFIKELACLGGHSKLYTLKGREREKVDDRVSRALLFQTMIFVTKNLLLETRIRLANKDTFFQFHLTVQSL